jgi:hypothetical protein
MSTRTIEAHPEMWPALDAPSDDDRRWFHQRPGAVVRLRPQFEDETYALDSVARVSGSSGIIRLATSDGPPGQPDTFMVVVDLLRVWGEPHGPDGESGRMRVACPEPVDQAHADALALAGVELVLQSMPHRPGRRRRHPRPARGFGR